MVQGRLCVAAQVGPLRFWRGARTIAYGFSLVRMKKRDAFVIITPGRIQKAAGG